VNRTQKDVSGVMPDFAVIRRLGKEQHVTLQNAELCVVIGRTQNVDVFTDVTM